MTGIFENLAITAGHKVKITTHAPGGVFVGDTRPGPLSHAYDPNVYGLIRSDKWDYVVIQDNQGFYSYGIGVFPPYSKVIEGHTQLRDSAVANNPCSKVLLFAGWCFKNGWPPDFNNGSDMNQRVYENYVFINNTLDEIVSPIGIAWNRIIKLLPTTDLWDTDEAHPSYAGSYLTAATIYSSIFRSSAEEVMYDGNLAAATARTMRKTAYETVIDSIAPSMLSKYTITLSINGNQLSADPGYKTYNWYEDNVLLGQTTTASYSPISGGHHYQVVATDAGDCTQRSATSYSHPLSVNNTSLQSDYISIQPNPATELVTISSSEMFAEVTISDIAGRIIYESAVPSYKCVVDISNWQKGVYMVQSKGNKGGTHSLKLLIQ